MAFLTLGGTAIRVQTSNASQDTSERGGGESRSYSGSLRNTTRWKKRSWKITTGWYLLGANADAIRAYDGTIQTLGGTIVNNGAVSVSVTIASSPFLPRGTKQQFQITLKEV